jgi:uracil phosphoribosyltransferase
MLATGGTFVEVIKEIKKYSPAKIIVGAVIASTYGVKVIK